MQHSGKLHIRGQRLGKLNGEKKKFRWELCWELEVLKRVYSITPSSIFVSKEVELSIAKALCIC